MGHGGAIISISSYWFFIPPYFNMKLLIFYSSFLRTQLYWTGFTFRFSLFLYRSERDLDLCLKVVKSIIKVLAKPQVSCQIILKGTMKFNNSTFILLKIPGQNSNIVIVIGFSFIRFLSMSLNNLLRKKKKKKPRKIQTNIRTVTMMMMIIIIIITEW